MTVSTDKVPISALRSLSAVSLHKAVQMAGLVAMVALVPRLFGAEDYGRFAFALSLSYLGQVLGDLGTLEVMGRFVPELPPTESSRLYMRTLAFKGIVGLFCGLITVGAALASVAWMSPAWAGLIGLSVAIHIVAWTPFQLALGLHRVGVWMAEQAWRQWVLLVLLLVLLPFAGLSGALWAIVVMEIVFCLLGFWWVRDYWQSSELRLNWAELAPYLRFGLGFFLANLATVIFYRSGPTLVELLTGDSRQTGYFNLALGLFLTGYSTVSQFAQSMLPALSSFRVKGQSDRLRRWLVNFVQVSWWSSCLGALVVWLLADWAVPLVFGREFAPAAASLKWISLAIPLATLLWAGNVLATVVGQGRLKFMAALAALLAFTVAALALTSLYGAVGAALALTLAVAVNVGVLGIYLRPFLIKMNSE